MDLSKIQPMELLPDPDNKPENWAKSIRRSMEICKQGLRKYCNQVGEIEVERCFDLESSFAKRRTQALLNTRDEIMKRSDCCYEDWILVNAQSDSYCDLEEYRLLFAASIWILDRIIETGIDDKELYKLLPTDDRLLDSFHPAPFFDFHTAALAFCDFFCPLPVT